MDRNLNSIRRFLMSVGVALRKESVDRNVSNLNMSCSAVSRSPQGERG